MFVNLRKLLLFVTIRAIGTVQFSSVIVKRYCGRMINRGVEFVLYAEFLKLCLLFWKVIPKHNNGLIAN